MGYNGVEGRPWVVHGKNENEQEDGKMKSVSMKLKRDERDPEFWVPVRQRDPDGFCGDGLAKCLRREFKLPPFADLRFLWLSLHGRSGADRVPVVVGYHEYSEYPFVQFNGRGEKMDHFDLDLVLKRFVGRRLYLQVEYQEEE